MPRRAAQWGMSQIEVALKIKLHGGELSRLVQQAEAAQRRIDQFGLKANRTQAQDYARMTQARERLGIRSEKSIQREIQATQAAYQRVARAGSLSMAEQARAADAAKRKISELTNEMGKLTSAQKAAGAAKGVAAVGMGVVAAGAVLKNPLEKAMDYEERMAQMSNTAYAGKDLATRKAGMAQLDGAVQKAYRTGGGTREGAAGALDMMVSSGTMQVADAIKALPQIMKAATAGGANPEEIAAIAIRAQQNMKIDPSRMPNVLNMAMAAGQAGGFELKDMAKWLPAQMAAASLSGLTGEAGFAKLAALNQAAATTAGSKDDAGNNVVNLLAKINSADTAKDVKKTTGLDLPKYLSEQRGKGVDSVDAFAALVRGQLTGNKEYQGLQTKLAATGKDDPARAQMLESMAKIAQGTAIGSVVQDRQAMMPLIAMMNDPAYMQGVLGKVNAANVGAGGAVDENFALIESLNSFKVRMAWQNKDTAMQAAYGETGGAVGGVASAFSSLAQSAPLLTGATIAATTALLAFSGTAGLAALAMGGGKGIPGVLGKGLGLLTGGGGLIPGAAGAGGLGILSRLGIVGALSGAGIYAAHKTGAAPLVTAESSSLGRNNFAAGNYLAASRQLSAGDFASSVVSKLGGAFAVGGAQKATLTPQQLEAFVKVDMSPDLRATVAQIKTQGAVNASINAGAVASRGRVFGGL